MTNVDRPNGFTFVRSLSGAPVSGLIRSIGVADGADIFIGDMLNLESGLAAPGATNDTAILGVALGFGKKDDMSQEAGGPFNPDNLEKRFYDDSESTHTDWVVYYIPADDAIFEVQTAVDLSASVVGSTADVVGTAGNQTTGRSITEATTSTNGDLTIVELPKIVGNDLSLINARIYVMFTRAEQAFHV